MAGTFERQKTRTKQTTQVRPLFGRDLKIVLSPDKTISNIQLNIPLIKILLMTLLVALYRRPNTCCFLSKKPPTVLAFA